MISRITRTFFHAVVVVCVITASLTAQVNEPSYDLLLKGGRVIDPKNNLDGVRDVAVKGDRIAAIASGIPDALATKVIDVSGLIVTPGLVDIHVHVSRVGEPGTVSDRLPDLFPDHLFFGSGVTTVVDAGGTGWRSFPEFRRRVIDTSKTRVLAMLNITGLGMINYEAEQNPADMDPEKTAAMAREHSDVVVGIKSAHWWQPSFVSVEKAVEAGTLADIPVMVDFGWFIEGKPYETMISELFRPGDISTHFFRMPAPLLDDNGQVRSYLTAGRKRGIKFDVGHGGASFYYKLAVPMIEQGFLPDSISTDLHSGSVHGAATDMLNVMSKFLALGVPLPEVIRLSTTNPATIVKRPELGQISVGAEADLAVLKLTKGEFGFLDAVKGKLKGTERLSSELTIRAGEVVFDFNGRTGIDWRDPSIKYPTY
jgi:dihydroorotase